MTWQLHPDENMLARYRERLQEGDVVYAIDHPSLSDDSLAVVKGTVDILSEMGSADLCLVAWPTFGGGPDYGETGVAIHTSSFDVFTHKEVLDLILRRDPSLLQTADTVDELLRDEMANTEVVALLGGASIARSLDAGPIFLQQDYIARHGLSS